MAVSINMKYSLQALAVTCILFFPFTLGKADDYAAGVVENEYLPNYGGYSSQNGDYPHEYGGGTSTSTTDAQPGYLFSKALGCFSDKQIYSSCEEAYRLTETGDLNVAPEYTDQYCSGPCLKETHLVLNCLGNILSHFRFYNKATIREVQETIKEGCSYGPRRGYFNVAEHIQADGGTTVLRASKFIIHGVVLMSLTHIFFL